MIKCPYCGKSHYTEDYHTSTAMGWTPVVKDGVRYDNDPNTHTTHCTCLECGGQFSFDNKGGIYKCTSPEEMKKRKVEIIKDVNLTKPETMEVQKELNFSTFTLKESNQKIVNVIDIEKWLDSVCFTYKGKEYTFDIDKFINDYFKEK